MSIDISELCVRIGFYLIKKLNLRKVLNIFPAPKSTIVWIEKDFSYFDLYTYRPTVHTYKIEDPEISLCFGDMLVAWYEGKIQTIDLWKIQEVEIELNPGRIELSYKKSGPYTKKGIRRGVLESLR